MKFRRLQPNWGLGTVYYILDVGRYQFSIRFMPWRMFPGFTLAKRNDKTRN